MTRSRHQPSKQLLLRNCLSHEQGKHLTRTELRLAADAAISDSMMRAYINLKPFSTISYL